MACFIKMQKLKSSQLLQINKINVFLKGESTQKTIFDMSNGHIYSALKDTDQTF